MDLDKPSECPVPLICIKNRVGTKSNCVSRDIESIQEEGSLDKTEVTTKKRVLDGPSQEESSLSDGSSSDEQQDFGSAAFTKSMAERHRRKNRQWLWRDYTLHLEKMEQFRHRLGLNPPNERPESPTTYFGWNRWGTMVKKGTINEPEEDKCRTEGDNQVSEGLDDDGEGLGLSLFTEELGNDNTIEG